MQHQSERIQDLAAREDAAEIVLGRGTLPDVSRPNLIERPRPSRNNNTYLELKHIPDAIDANQDQISRRIVVLVQELDENVETTGADKHLQRRGGRLVHLAHEGGGLEPDLVGVLPRGELCNDGDAANEAQVLLQFHIVEDDLSSQELVVCATSENPGGWKTNRVYDLEQL